MKIFSPQERRSSGPRRRRDRGAVLVEAAIALPILLLIVLGSIEAGMAWNTKAGTTNAIRSGLLRAAAIADEPETDLRILQSIVGEVGANKVDRLDWVIIFDGSSNNGDHANTVEQCAGAIAGGGIDGAGGTPRCVVYGPTTLTAVAQSTLDTTSFDSGNGAGTTSYTCEGGKLDTNFCAPSRTFGGDIPVGVALSYGHEWTTGIFPFDPPVLNELAVSSTFADEGASITGSTTYTAGETLSYDSGSFDNGLNAGNATWVGNTSIGTVPADSTRNFLGPLGQGQSLTLTVTDLPNHNVVCVEFDLYLIGSWDGAGTNGGDPNTGDMFRVDIGGDGTYEHNQNYVEGNTNQASEVNTLGFDQVTTGGWGDQVIPMKICQTGHQDSTATIDFSALLSHPDWQNEGWGIDNVKVTTGWS